MICLVLAGSVFLAFHPVLRADFLRWDDQAFVTRNESVYVPLDREGFTKIFGQKVAGQYVPLTILSYAVDYRIGGEGPAGHHTTNLILHILNTLLVFFLAQRLGLRVWAAALAAALFAFHPMRVESVAWIAQRKQVLFSAFFLLSLLVYDWRLGLIREERGPIRARLTWMAANLLGVLSALANPMALGLPAAFLLLDWFRGRTIKVSVVVEKFPLLLATLVPAYLTVAGVERGPVVHPWRALLIAVWTCVFYLRQYCFPVELVPIVRVPGPIALTEPGYALSAGYCVLLAFCLLRLRKTRWLMLAAGLFGCSLLFLIFFGSTKSVSLAADRYMYLPGVGLTLLAAYLVQWAVESLKGSSWLRWVGKGAVGTGAVLVLLVSALACFRQTYVWQNDIALWRHQLVFHPEEPVALNGLAVALRAKKEFQRAEEHYRQIVKVKVQGYELRLDDEAREDIRRVQYIINLMQRAKAEAPDLEDIPFRLGQYLQDLGLYADAVAEYRTAVQINPGFKDVYLDLGKIYLDLKDLDKAALAFRQYYGLEPVREGDFLAVVDTYAEFLAGQPHNFALRSGMLDVISAFVDYANRQALGAESYTNLGFMYLRAGETDEAKSALQRAIDLNPRQPKALYALGVILMEQGDVQTAMRTFERVVSIDKKHADAFVKMGNIRYGQGDVKAAREFYRAAIGAEPKHAQAHFNLGYTYEESGQLKDAVANYRLALRYDPANPEAHFNLGNVYLKQDNLDGAVNQYLQTVAQNPDHMDAWINLAVTSFNAGHVKKAKEYYQEAVLLGFDPPPEMVRQFGPAR